MRSSSVEWATNTMRPKPHILVVDDDRDAREALAAVLVDAGYEVEGVATGSAAMELLRAGLRPSAAILDMITLVADGQDVLARLQFDPDTKDIPIFVLSTWLGSQASDRVRLLPKPLDASELLRQLRECGLDPSVTDEGTPALDDEAGEWHLHAP